MKKSIGLFLFTILWSVICPLLANALFSEKENVPNNNPSADSEPSSDVESSIPQENLEGITVLDLMTAQKMQDIEGVYSEETLKAIAVIVRTQLIFSDEKTDFSSDLELQIPSYVSSTKGIVITYDGKLINPPYHISSYKTTASSPLLEPYLLSVATPESPDDIKTVTTVAKNDFKNKLKTLCPGIVFDEDALINNIEQDGNNRCKFINAGNCAISATAFANEFSLPSLCFEIIEKGDIVEIISYGEGDGIGMSILGAEIYAKNGMSFEEILSHYYSDIEISPFKEGSK